jgi:hypothetical protein
MAEQANTEAYVAAKLSDYAGRQTRARRSVAKETWAEFWSRTSLTVGGANHHDAKVFSFALVRINTESLIRNFEGNFLAGEVSHHSSHVDISTPGAINCGNDAPSFIITMISGSISRRWAIPRRRFGRINALRGGRRSVAEDRHQEHREEQVASFRHDSLTWQVL